MNSDELNAFVNALQLCVKSPISNYTIPENGNILITFDHVEKNDSNLKSFEKIIHGHWDRTGNTYEIPRSDDYSLAELTQFLLLTRMSSKNMAKLAELDERFKKFTDALKTSVSPSKSVTIQSPAQASGVIFDEVRKKNMTLRKMAELSGLTQVALSNFKSGKDIRLSNFIKLTDVLGLKIRVEPL